MVAKASVDAKRIAREFAAAIRDEPSVTQLWFAEHPDIIELVVITSGSTMADERRIASVFTDLIVQHQDANIRPRTLNPRHFVDEAAFHAALPHHAMQIPLHG